MSEQVLDYAIVGGGISGVYSAWRLKESNRDLGIEVFENVLASGGADVAENVGAGSGNGNAGLTD